MMPDLKPCPFCGSEDVYFVGGVRDPIWPLFPAAILCYGCGMGVEFAYFPTVEEAKKEAYESWDRRSDHAET